MLLLLSQISGWDETKVFVIPENVVSILFVRLLRVKV